MIGTTLRRADRIGAWKARWGIGRMSYLVPVGLYAVGAPGPHDPVIVTANYKMSFDLVRRELAGRNLWLLVLETHGINVWCAAGKGTFGTAELISRIASVRLAEVVEHRRVLLPMLAAPGVAGHEVRARSGFEVLFGGIRAADLPRLLDAGLATAPDMRELTFTFRERLALVPMELVPAAKGSLPILLALLLACGWRSGAFSPSAALPALAAFLGAILAGSVVTPLLLPWLPTRSFAAKGALAGLAWAALFQALGLWRGPAGLAPWLLLPAVSAFLALNFTGSTPYTSRSGVKREMRLSMPLMAAGLLLGVGSWIVNRFF